MRKIILAAGLAMSLVAPAFAQPAQTNEGTTRPGTTTPDSTAQGRQGQYGPANDSAKQFGTDDQKGAPNAACTKGSKRAECQDQRIQNNVRPGTTGTAPNGPANPGPNPGEQGSGG